MLVSVTRLRVRSVRYLPAFFWKTIFIQRQVIHAPGFAGGRLLNDVGWTFWTLTAWENEQAMKAFRGAAPHAKAMPRLIDWCDEASYAHWAQSGDTLPSWPEAHARLVRDGRLSRVSHPSPNHNARHFPEPRLRPLVGTDLNPRATVE